MDTGAPCPGALSRPSQNLRRCSQEWLASNPGFTTRMFLSLSGARAILSRMSGLSKTRANQGLAAMSERDGKPHNRSRKRGLRGLGPAGEAVSRAATDMRLRNQKPLKRGTPYVPSPEDRTLVAFAAANGFSLRAIGCLLRPGGVNHETVRKHFPRELELGRAKANLAVSMRLYALTEHPNPRIALRAQMFWLARRDPERWGQRSASKQSTDFFGKGATIPILYDDGSGSARVRRNRPRAASATRTR